MAKKNITTATTVNAATANVTATAEAPATAASKAKKAKETKARAAAKEAAAKMAEKEAATAPAKVEEAAPVNAPAPAEAPAKMAPAKAAKKAPSAADMVNFKKNLSKKAKSLATAIMIAHEMATDGDETAKYVCAALGINDDTTATRATRNELRLAILRRIPFVVAGAPTTTPARLVKYKGEKNRFKAVITTWEDALTAAAGNTNFVAGSYTQQPVTVNNIAWVTDGGKETATVNRAASTVKVYTEDGKDITAENTTFVSDLYFQEECRRVAQRAGKVTESTTYAAQMANKKAAKGNATSRAKSKAA